ncbi:Ig-like domain-containing protein [Niabella hibiscisoli]|uniref:Ig-like domain-containing protein n=1 Tax=Niabella hibiscisoli TaxID=1825928 RepID=UPI001F0FE210|nr:Ig-like domain-containing protein [Niabella hibiscisoli]MCH5718980.1 Ig-like domain-containing protein [Niabella hibiscisoli]
MLSVTAATGCVNSADNNTLISLQLNKQSLTLETGQSEQVTLSTVPALTSQDAVHWSTADEQVAIVDKGLVSAIAEGETTVTVSYENIRKTVLVKVNAPAIDKKLAVLFDKQFTGAPQPEFILNEGRLYTRRLEYHQCRQYSKAG